MNVVDGHLIVFSPTRSDPVLLALAGWWRSKVTPEDLSLLLLATGGCRCRQVRFDAIKMLVAAFPAHTPVADLLVLLLLSFHLGLAVLRLSNVRCTRSLGRSTR